MEPKYKPNDPQLIENILAEVKRSGMFDQFRKDCISDVDTKPAYQNLQFKVENTVSKFLSAQKWSVDTNRNQLREKLRNNILDSGYLDNGIERIVDQVLYPKMDGFKSQIEELVYSFLNIDRPKRKLSKEEPVEDALNISSLLPKDLEAVSSPESEKPKSPASMHDTEKIVEENDDDFESPAFEPLEGVVVENAGNKDDSHLSGLSNMSSENSGKNETKAPKDQPAVAFESTESVKQEEDETQLSQISSGSRLSIVVQSEKDSLSPKPEVLNITEEAQMPKFSENSNSIDSRAPTKETIEGQSVFDFKKEEIEFKGPCRKQMTLDEKLKEEIYESENKHANIFKTDDLETNSHSSDMKLEIVENHVTESESRLKIDIQEEPSSSKPEETEVKMDEKLNEKMSSPTDTSKKDRSSSHHRSTSKSSKHSSKDRERSSSKHTSSSHHSKSRHSDKDRHHSSSSRHKSSSSSKKSDRHSSNSGKDKSSRDKHRDYKSRSDHKSKDDKRNSDDHQSGRDKSSSRRTPENEILPKLNPEKSEEQYNAHLSEKSDEIDKNLELIEDNPLQEYQNSPKSSPVRTESMSQVESSPKPDTDTPHNIETTPKAPHFNKTPSSHELMSDEDDFYGFPENEITPGTSNSTFITPNKISLPSDSITPGPSSQKSVCNQSIFDEDSFHGFDDNTPKKRSPDINLEKNVNLPEPKIAEEESSGKRVRKPNTKYLSKDFTTHDQDLEDIEMETKSSKKRKRFSEGISRLMKKQKSEDKSTNDEIDKKDDIKAVEDESESNLTLETDKIETGPSEDTDSQNNSNSDKAQKSNSPKDLENDDAKSVKSSKKHLKHDRSSRSTPRRK
uniref:CSON014340 protein n=1 Tax=Culicoides sonorensis TaxID=179676 RepID=A0A336MAA7_CULSO